MSVEISRAYRLAAEARDYRLKRDVLLAADPTLAEDEETLLDTLEGCSTIHDQLAAIAREAVELEALAEGLKSYQEALAKRRTRFAWRSERLRGLVTRTMSDLAIRKVVAPDLTLSVRALAPSLVIKDENAIPSEFMRISRFPDRAAIKKALVDGEHIEGAELSNGGETISIRVS